MAAGGDVPIPALLRAARGAYGHAIRGRLAAAGLGDLPRNAPYILGGMANHGVPVSQLVRELGVTKQAAGQLVDTLVVRGYLERRADETDRRRVTLELTERGAAAAAEVRAGVLAIDERLAELLTDAEVEGLRKGLVALTTIREELEARDR
jgi:DNA-binding MarR family transcriptional regulator